MLTVLFGNTLWKSINIFVKNVNNEFLKLGIHPDTNYSAIIVLSYVGIHLLVGVLIGLYAGKLPQKIKTYSESLPVIDSNESTGLFPKKDKRKRKNCGYSDQQE